MIKITDNQLDFLLKASTSVLTGVKSMSPGEKLSKYNPGIVNGQSLMILAQIVNEIREQNK